MSCIRPINLRIEYKVNPLGLDEQAPRFSWEVETSVRGGAQKAYQILVASSPTLLEQDTGDLWDSGCVASDQTFHIVYKGQPLQSRMTCWWKVRLWDNNREPSSYSEPAFWTMGLLTPEDWEAEWIGFDEAPPAHEAIPQPMTLSGCSWISNTETPKAPEKNSVLAFRRRIVIKPNVQRARLALSAGGQFMLYIDGRHVGKSDGRFWAWIRPAQFDLTPYLTEGEHVLAVENTFLHAPAAGIIGKLLIDYADGSKEEVTTDTSWRVASSPTKSWSDRDFDDGAWPSAYVVCAADDPPYGKIAPAPIEVPPCPYTRKSFTYDKPLKRATLYITALGLYEAYLNGKRVGDLRFVPGWTDYSKRVLYQTYDVTQMIKQGENALGAILGHGWYSGYLGFDIFTRGHYGKQPQLFAQLEIESMDGSVQRIGTDATWKATFGPIIGSDIYMGELYDARLEMPGWNEPHFDDSAWRPVTVDTKHKIQIEAHVGSPVRKTMEITPKSVHRSPEGGWIFDMGQNMVGVVRARIFGQKGSHHVFRFGETINPDGTLYVENLRNARATDEYWKRTDEEEIWEPRFTFHGFRYVEWTGPQEEPSLTAVTGLVLHSDAPITGSFECSNEIVNRLQQNIQWSQRGNYFETPTDCPQRDERLGWMGDAQVFAPTGCFNMDAASFFTKWMKDVLEAQSEEGAFSDVCPRYRHVTENVPGWADAGIIVPWSVYEAYGDIRLLEKTYDAMCRYVDNLERLNPNYLWLNRRGNDYGDWLSIKADTPKEIVATAFFARSADLLHRIAVVLNKREDATRYKELFEKIRRAFVQAYVSPDGRIHGDTQTCYVLALHFNILEGNLREAAANLLVERIKERDWHLSTGFLGCAYLLPTLTEIGRIDVAYRLIENTDFPSWGYPILHGATTMWERWDGWTHDKGFQDPGMNSFNHYAFGAVGEWLYRVMAGIAPEDPGYRRIKLCPQPGGNFTHAKAEYHAICGRVLSEWQIKDNTLHVHVVIPGNSCATLRVPSTMPEKVCETNPNIEQKVRPIGFEPNAALFELGAGEYHFHAPWEK